MGFSPINNHNYGNHFKSGSFNRSFNDGTEELLRNVLGGPSPHDYQNPEGDSLSLSPSVKKQITQQDVVAAAKNYQVSVNGRPEQIPQAVKNFFIRYSTGSGSKVKHDAVDLMPDSVKNFFQSHTVNDLQSMPLSQMPDDVKQFVKMQFSLPDGQPGSYGNYHGIDGIHAVNPDDMARKLVNSLFVKATSSQEINDGGNRNSAVRNDQILKTVSQSLERTFKDLGLDSANLPAEVKDDLNSVYVLAQRKIDHWATANGAKTDKTGPDRLVF